MSTNKSREKREELLVKLEQIRTYIESSAQPEIGAELLHAIEEIEQDINGRKFGLVYEEHREKIEDILETHRPVLVEDESAAVICGGETNLLIEGDNLAALKLLEEEYQHKIKNAIWKAIPGFGIVPSAV